MSSPDLRVEVRDGRGGEAEHFLAHKVVLCALSGFFRKRMTTGGGDNVANSVEVRADRDAFAAFLDLVYEGRAAVDAKDAGRTEEALKVSGEW